jgi:PKD repeat protein
MSLLAAVALPAACGGGGGAYRSPNDASGDRAPMDAPEPLDSGVVPLALDFTASGCSSIDLEAPRCRGTAPLTVTFSAIVSEDPVQYLWTFGDSTTPSAERAPVHTYTLPGRYNVSLVARGAAGTLQRAHDGYMEVLHAGTGQRCDVDGQCAQGQGPAQGQEEDEQLACICGAAASCHPAFTRGLCTRACADRGDPDDAGAVSACATGASCFDLGSPGAAGDGQGGAAGTVDQDGAMWRRTLCLHPCDGDEDCAPGLACRDLRAATGSARWSKGCFVFYPLDVGIRCGDLMGRPLHEDCTSGLCADLGAFGRCSAPCTGNADCPAGTACGRFGDGRALCLRACSPSFACADDVLLACEAPGATGPHGFTVASDATPAAASYCAPRRCSGAADCGPAGRCPPGGGHCQKP